MHLVTRIAPLLLSFAVLCGASAKTGQAKTLNDVLGRMDESAASFHGLVARLERVEHTAVINDDYKSAGELRLRRTGPKNIQVVVRYSKPDPKDWALEGNTFQMYYPKRNAVEIYDLGRQSSLIDQFLLLGFGTSGKELAKNYVVKLAGEETVDGKATYKLHLVPKSKDAQKYLAAVDLWYSDEAGYPVRQKFYQPSGDYQVVGYSDVRVNPALTDADIKLKLPGNVKKEYPQK